MRSVEKVFMTEFGGSDGNSTSEGDERIRQFGDV